MYLHVILVVVSQNPYDNVSPIYSLAGILQLTVNGRYTHSVERTYQLETGRYEHLQIHIMDNLDWDSALHWGSHSSATRSTDDHSYSSTTHWGSHRLI